MTHSPIPVARLLLQPSTVLRGGRARFLPLHDLPGQYLKDSTAHLAHSTALAWLALYDLFLPDLRLIGTGVCARSWVSIRNVVGRRALAVRGQPAAAERFGTDFLVRLPPRNHRHRGRRSAQEQSPRWRSPHMPPAPLLSAAGVCMVVVGSDPEASKARLLQQYHELGGQDGRLDFAPHLDDAELRELYARARLTIVPSCIEGFSIPIVEASANGPPGPCRRLCGTCGVVTRRGGPISA